MIRHFHYLQYLIKHKWFVFFAGLHTKAPFHRLIIHDWSKFLPVEWIAYCNFFNPAENAKSEAERKADFRLAWNHHIHWNKHHFQYWVNTSEDGETRPQPMPEKYIREMVADWFGAGRGITGKWDDTPKWWAIRRSKMPIHPSVKRRVDELILEATKKLHD